MSKLRKFPIIERSAPLIDLDVGGADGRTVTAYAATFGNEYPVVDFDGDYDETINRTAFNRHLSQHGLRNVAVLVNHGLTIWGTPSERFANTIGVAVRVEPDSKGLITVTRYNKSSEGDDALERWRNGDYQAQSFRGPIIRSTPKRRGGDGRTKIERLELGLIEYGPALRAANTEAQLVAIRSELLIEQFAELTDDEREHLRKLLADTPAVDSSTTPGTPEDPPAPDTPPEADPSIEALEAWLALERSR